MFQKHTRSSACSQKIRHAKSQRPFLPSFLSVPNATKIRDRPIPNPSTENLHAACLTHRLPGPLSQQASSIRKSPTIADYYAAIWHNAIHRIVCWIIGISYFVFLLPYFGVGFSRVCLILSCMRTRINNA